MIRPGPRNLITDVAGLLVGNAISESARSGVSVLVTEQPTICAADIRGGAPTTRGADVLQPGGMIELADAVFLSGGSAFGLDTGGGVMAWLALQGRGIAFGGTRVPIVAGAILFDLMHGGDKQWGLEPPYYRLGIAAAEAAAYEFALGSAGAGLGAMCGDLKGGLGSASLVYDEGTLPVTVGALVAVNALGSAVMPGQATFWAWDLEQGNELGGQPVPHKADPAALQIRLPDEPALNTTIAVIATDAILNQAEAARVAIMAQTGLARALRPIHSPLDGDAIFVLATGRGRRLATPAELTRLGGFAADTLARAVARGVYEASDLGDMKAYRSVHGESLRIRLGDTERP